MGEGLDPTAVIPADRYDLGGFGVDEWGDPKGFGTDPNHAQFVAAVADALGQDYVVMLDI